jgi:hypothetical protein
MQTLQWMFLFKKEATGQQVSSKFVISLGLKPTLLVHCLYEMLPLNHKRATSSLAPPPYILCNKKFGDKKRFPFVN